MKDFEAQKATMNLNQEEGAVLQIQDFPQTNVQDFAFREQETLMANRKAWTNVRGLSGTYPGSATSVMDPALRTGSQLLLGIVFIPVKYFDHLPLPRSNEDMTKISKETRGGVLPLTIINWNIIAKTMGMFYSDEQN